MSHRIARLRTSLVLGLLLGTCAQAQPASATAAKPAAGLPAAEASPATAVAQAAPLTISLTAAQASALGVGYGTVEPVSALPASAVARVVPAQGTQSVVAAAYPGIASKVLVTLGSQVRAGDPLVRFESAEYFEAQRAQAEAASQSVLAADALQRDKALLAEGIIPAARLRATEARARDAQAALAARNREMASAGIRPGAAGSGPMLVAPGAGTVVELATVQGQRFGAGDVLVRIARPDRMELEATLPSPAAGLRQGDKVVAPSHRASGTVLGIAPAVDGTGVTRLRVGLDNPGTLQIGAQVPVQIHSAAAPGAAAGSASYRVPARSVFQWRNQPAVFVAHKDAVMLLPVIRLAGDDGYAVIRGTLSPGERVVTSGMAALKGALLGGE